MQDRFTSLVPALTKYGATTVGVTLLVIGVVGLYETLTEGAEVADQAQPALAGDFPSLILWHLHFLGPQSTCPAHPDDGLLNSSTAFSAESLR